LKRFFQLLITLQLFYYSVAFAGWSEDLRLTYRGNESDPQVIASNDTVHVAWQDISDQHQISHIRSLNFGQAWGDIENFVEAGHRGLGVSLSRNFDRILIGWSDVDLNGPNPVANISLVNSLFGENWSIPSYVFPFGFQGSVDQILAVSGDSVLLAYIPIYSDTTGNQMVLFKNSSDLGTTWSDSQIIGRTPMFLNGFQMKKCGGSIYVMWSGLFLPNPYTFEVILTISHDGGQSWSEMVQLSPDSNASQHPCIACDEETGNVAVGWMDYALSHSYPGDLFIRITTDGGYSWSDIQYTTVDHHVSDPGLAIVGDTIWAAWNNVGTAQIAFSKSTD
jgi:hypothetical protein